MVDLTSSLLIQQQNSALTALNAIMNSETTSDETALTAIAENLNVLAPLQEIGILNTTSLDSSTFLASALMDNYSTSFFSELDGTSSSSMIDSTESLNLLLTSAYDEAATILESGMTTETIAQLQDEYV